MRSSLPSPVCNYKPFNMALFLPSPHWHPSLNQVKIHIFILFTVHCCLVIKSCPTLCDPVDCSPPGPPSMGFSRQECRGGLPFPSPGDLPDPGLELMSPAAGTLGKVGPLPLTAREPCILPTSPRCDGSRRRTGSASALATTLSSAQGTVHGSGSSRQRGMRPTGGTLEEGKESKCREGNASLLPP